jgi:hypothetical protein
VGRSTRSAVVHSEGRVLEELFTWADLFRAVLELPDSQRAILQLFSYLSRVAPNLSAKELAERIQRAIPERNDIVSTLAEKWLEQGAKTGREEGRRETTRPDRDERWRGPGGVK